MHPSMRTPGSHQPRFETVCTLLLAAALGLAAWHSLAAWTPWYTVQRAAAHRQRLADLDAMRQALAAYKADNSRYPANAAFTSAVAATGKPDPDWIPGLAPRYLPALPRDPARSDDPTIQYLYHSDGQDYKLLAHGGGDCALARKTDQALVDPARDCWAYGYWTPGAANW